MSWKDPTSAISWFDLVVISLVFLGGFFYLHDVLHWGVGWVGDSEYGDAAFWWNGALHIAHGIFQDNPGKGFRPGYFILTGLTIPVLGEQFKHFYIYFLSVFLLVVSLFYLSLRPFLSRWIAFFSVALLVINPYTAEWVATSTTDAMGLLLNLAALTCLLNGVRKDLNPYWLMGFGILFSLATLTRPLVTPFIFFSVLGILLYRDKPLKKRLIIAGLVLFSFCLPTFIWMSIQKMTIDRWSISTNDASAFYAASDPAIQVWNPNMYDVIHQKAMDYYHIKSDQVNDQQMNEVFWRETFHNYLEYFPYHLKRLMPHIWEVARFSPLRATHASQFWRILFFEMIILGLMTKLLMTQRKFQASFLFGLGLYIYLSPSFITYLVLAGFFLSLIAIRKNKLGIFLLGGYWLTGVAALYFVGGTWGKPSFSALFDINALGYRLGSQVFFMGDLLAAYCLLEIGGIDQIFPRYQKIQNFFEKSEIIPTKMINAFFEIAFLSLFLVYFVGSMIVIERVYNDHYLSKKSYPDLTAIKEMYYQTTHKKLAMADDDKGAINPAIFTHSNIKSGKKDILFTGEVSPFIWQLSGQDREELMVYFQNQVSPLTMGPNSQIIDISANDNIKKLVNKQGAFIIRDYKDNHNKSNLAYYLTNPELIAFVPLAKDKNTFDLANVIWFNAHQNATQLDSGHMLLTENARVTWAMDSGAMPFKRRFFVEPKLGHNAILKLPLSKEAVFNQLNFAYTLEKAPNSNAIIPPYFDMQIYSFNQKNYRHLLLSNREATTDSSLRTVTLPIDKNMHSIEIVFNHLTKGTGIWIYEFNLESVQPTDLAQGKNKHDIS